MNHRNDPRFQQIVRAQMSRRTLLRGAGAAGLAAGLAACGTGSTDSASSKPSPKTVSYTHLTLPTICSV